MVRIRVRQTNRKESITLKKSIIIKRWAHLWQLYIHFIASLRCYCFDSTLKHLSAAGSNAASVGCVATEVVHSRCFAIAGVKVVIVGD